MLIHAIFAAIKPRCFPACFIEPQHARRMIPCQRAFEARYVVLAQR